MILRKAKRREALCLCLCLCARAFEMMLWRCCSRSRIRVLGSIAGASCRRLLSSSPVHCKYLRNSYNGAEVYLLGTCHVSPDSVHRVREIIKTIKPTDVALELCEGRAIRLRSEGHVQAFNPADFFKFPGSFGQQAFSHHMKSLQDLLRLFGINYGEEFRVALDEGNKIQSKFHYIDRDVNETLREVKKNLSFVAVVNFVMSFPQHAESYPELFENASKIRGIEDFVANETLLQEMIKFLGDHFPEATKAILHERNELMTQRLRGIEGRIVAVVGLGHMQGIQELWQTEEP